MGHPNSKDHDPDSSALIRAWVTPVAALFYAGVCLFLGTLPGSVSWWRSAAMNGVLLLLLLATAWFSARGDNRPRNRFLTAVALLLLLALAAGALRSPSPARSWRLLILLGAAAAVFYLVTIFARRCGTSGLALVFAATGTAAAAWGLADFIFGGASRVAAPLGHHNYMAGFLLLHLPITIGALQQDAQQGRSLQSGIRNRKSAAAAAAALLAAAAIQAIAIVFTGSLAGIAVLVLFIALASTRLLVHAARAAADQRPANGPRVHPDGNRSLSSRYAGTSVAAPPGARPPLTPGTWHLAPFAAGGLALVLAAILFVSVRAPQGIPGNAARRVAAIAGNRGDPSLSLDNRVRYARAGMAMFAARPLLGWGLGAVPLVSSLYREQTPGVEPPGEALPQLHSLPVNLLAETGLLGLAGFAGLLLFVLARGSGPARIAFAAYGLFSLADYQLDLPAIVLSLAAVAALSQAASRRATSSGPLPVRGERAWGNGRPGTRSSPPRLAPRMAAAWLVLALIALVLATRSSVAHYLYAQGQTAAAAKWDALAGFYDFEEGVRADRVGRGEQARDAYLLAAARMPDTIPAAEQAGNALLAAGRDREAMPLLERAAALDYYFTLAHFHLGRARLRLGDRQGAIRAFATSFLVQPATVFAQAWTSSPEREVYEESLERAIDRLYDLAAFNGEGLPLDQARSVATDKVTSRRWDELGAFLMGRRALLPSGRYRRELFEMLDQDAEVNHCLIVFRRLAGPKHIAPVTLLSPAPDLRLSDGIGVIRGVPPVRAIDLLR